MIDEIVANVLATVTDGADYPVFDGSPAEHEVPDSGRYVIVGGQHPPYPAGYERPYARIYSDQLHISCIAVGKAATMDEARTLAESLADVVQGKFPKRNADSMLSDEPAFSRVDGGYVAERRLALKFSLDD